MSYSVLTSIFGDSVQVKLIEFFIVNDTGMFNLTSIAKELDISHSRVHDLIDDLVENRFIFETRSKRIRLFETNTKHPINKKLTELYKLTKAYNVAREL